ncbi:MAG: peptidoglycan DD-metalloendopeptidase family protein [Ignavibacteriales bacterium]|nr:peptidoglycan DD-metalloendopeptidase family protein [Ignavibacteriales bacterium]
MTKHLFHPSGSVLALCVTLLVWPVGVVSAQQASREITQKERELSRLRTEIQSYEKKLGESVKRERSTLEHLDNLEKQSTLIRRLVNKLKEEERQMSADILKARSSIGDLERQLQSLKNHYAKYVRSVYKNGRVYDLELLFSSNSINQLSIRIAYLRKFSEQRVKDLQRIVQNKTDLEQQNEKLQKTLADERRLIAEKSTEESSLKKKMTQRQRVLSTIRNDKKLYKQELNRRTQAVRQIEQFIADLIEKERIRKEREAAAARDRLASSTTPAPEPAPVGSFEFQRGSLRWPVSSGKIASRFGNQVHPVLKTVTQNTGIDITVPSGSDVQAVADGEVSVLSFLPGFGNVVILNHYNGFRTVYAHLADITVSESQKIRAGEVIAKSGESIAGAILHFEIWKEREKQNPEVWLAKQR